MRVVVRAFNEDGYHKDIAIMDERQLRQYDVRVDEDIQSSFSSGLVGVGASIDPTKFPEMVKFQVVIER